MKLDQDLVREILLAIEATGHDPYHVFQLELPGREETEVSYHVMLLDEAGFLHGQDMSSSDGILWHPMRLTMKGHEFLDTVRDPEVWRETKVSMAKIGGGGLGIVKDVASAVIKGFLKDKLGIELP